MPPTAEPVQAPPTPANPLTFYGFVDAHYGYDFKNDNTQDRPGFLYSHDHQNEFTVNNAILGVRYQDDNVGLDYAPTGHVLVRLEGWVLNARDKVFTEAGGATRHTYANLTSSIALSF